MTDDKQSWPKPQDIVVMTTKERNEMERFISQLAFGIGMKHKLRETYKAGFKAGREQDEWKIASGEVRE